MKGISLITNFGCDTNCWYCIWRHHPLKDVSNNTDWDKLECALALFPQDKISISGGGDPLFRFENNQSWYGKLFFLCEKHNKKIDIHTANIERVLYSEIKIYKFNKFILHLNYSKFLNYFKGSPKIFHDIPEKLRLAVVFTSELTLSQT